MSKGINQYKLEQVISGAGFFAALDQSGGSTPGALRHYGVPAELYADEQSMFLQVQKMRERIITSESFVGTKVIASILFEKTMRSMINGKPLPVYMWEEKGVVPFLKVDQGLTTEADGVQLMKPIAGLKALLADALPLGVVGTKMRSLIKSASKSGIAAAAAQQFEIGEEILTAGLVPILEPEVSLAAADREAAEDLLLSELHNGLEALVGDKRVLLKLTLPAKPDLYLPLIEHPRVLRVLALSGGYSRTEACQHLVQNHRMIASFSRALLEDLRYGDSDAEFDKMLSEAIDEIYTASVEKS